MVFMINLESHRIDASNETGGDGARATISWSARWLIFEMYI